MKKKAIKETKKTTCTYERPRICCIDIEHKAIETLKSSGYNVYEGTLGNKISIPNNNQYDSCEVLLNRNWPTNLHEFEIIDYKTESKVLENEINKNLKGLKYEE